MTNEYKVIIGKDNCDNFVGAIYLESKMVNRIVNNNREEFIKDMSNIIFEKLMNKKVDIACYIPYNHISKELISDMNRKIIDILYREVDDFEVKKDAEDYYHHNTFVRIIDKDRYLAVINVIDSEIDGCEIDKEYIKKVFMEYGSTTNDSNIDIDIYGLLSRSLIVEKINNRCFIIGCELSNIEEFDIDTNDITIYDYIVSIVYITLLEKNNDVWFINALLYNPNVYIFDIIINTLKDKLNSKGVSNER